MLIYIVNLILILFWGMVFNKNYKIKNVNKEKILFFMMFFQLFFLSAFRDISIGTDTHTYHYIFKQINNMSIFEMFKYNIEPGFILLNKLSSIFSKQPQVIIITTSFLTIITTLFVIKKYALNKIIATYLYVGLAFYYMAFNITRQSLAMSIILLCFYFLVNNESKKKYICFIIAISIHYSAIIFLPILLIGKTNITTKLINLIILFLCLLVAIPIIIILIKVASLSFPEIGAYFMVSRANRSIGYYLFLILKIILCISILVLNSRKYNYELRKDMNLLTIILFFDIYLSILSLTYYGISRFVFYYEVFLVLIIPNFIELFFEKKVRYIIYGFVIIFCVVYILNLIPNNPFYGIDSYKTYF